MSKDPKEYLKHIRDESAFLLTVINYEISESDFLKNETIKRAVVRSLEIIGEAAKKIPVEFKDKHDTIMWKSMSGMRDRLIHDYMGVNYSLVFDVAKNKIPELYERVCKIIDDLDINRQENLF